MLLNISADIHVGVPGKLDDIMWALQRARTYNAEHNITDWLVLGDLFHDREVINVRDLCVFSEFLEETISKYGQKMHVFPGNHDMFFRNSWDINSLIPLGKHLTTYNNISIAKFGGRRMFILPFVHYESKYMDILRKMEKRATSEDVLLTHVGVKNSVLNTCFLLQSWSVVDFTDSKFRRVYAGHYHTEQKVGDNLWYPGSLIPFKFDEGDVDHGFYVYDTDANDHKFVSIWDGVVKDEKTPPQFMTITEDMISEADVRGNIVRVARDGERTHNQLEELRKLLLEKGARDVRWMDLSTQEAPEKLTQMASKAASAAELFERFLKDDKDGSKDLIKKILLKMNTEVIAEGDRKYEYTGGME